MKWMAVIYFLCGDPVGITTNNEALRAKFYNPDAEVVLPKREDIDIYRMDLEDLSGNFCT